MASTQIHITLQSLKSFSKILGLIVLIILGISFWYVAIPIAFIFYLYKKNKTLSSKLKIIFSVSITIIFLLLGIFNIYSNREPVLTISEPESGISVQSERVSVVGTVNPKKSIITINGIPVEVDSKGNFSYDIRLKNENNDLKIEAKNGDKVVSNTLNVKRIYTEEELAEIERIKAEEERKKAEKEAEEKAKLEAYYKTPAGKICKDNPTWSKSDCEKLADGKIWIGMSIDMVKYKRGLPRSVNTSNYGYGNQYQWCWDWNYNPSCFYGEGDGIVDSYN